MAYAGLVSLRLQLEQFFLYPIRFSLPPDCEENDIVNLIEKIEFLKELLESSLNERLETSDLEGRIMDVVHASEDFVDMHLSGALDSWENYLPVLRFRFFCMLRGLCISEDIYQANLNSLFHVKFKFAELVRGFEIVAEEAANMKLCLKMNKGELEDEVLNSFQKVKITESIAKNSGAASSSIAPIVVFDEDWMKVKEEVKEELIGQSSKLKVISVVGMGGIGKTTFAANIYSEPSTAYHFYVTAWVTITQSYTIKGLLLHILLSMGILTDSICGDDEDQLKSRVYKALKGQRYLIIMDDIWDFTVWDSMKMVLPDDNNGSRIILTTRLQDIAIYAGSSNPHQMPLMSSQQCWNLLSSKVFEAQPIPFELRDIGMQIARNCHGLPLSVLVISGILSNMEMTKNAWNDVGKHVASKVLSCSDQCLEILKLSYKYLPHRLKACFLYMGGLPENSEIKASQLTKIWIAEGFFQQNQAENLEEVAERCLEELADRNLILRHKLNFDGKIKSFKIHNLLLNFCCVEAKRQEFLYMTNQHIDLLQHLAPSYHCRLFLHPTASVDEDRRNSVVGISFTRSLIIFDKRMFPLFLIGNFKVLKVLDANSIEFLHFPTEILELLSLRFVAFKCKGNIPALISNLWNLQTVIIHQLYSLFKRREDQALLPLEIWSMSHLRHICFKEIAYLDPADAASAIVILEKLQTVTGIRNLRFDEDMLKRIPNIKKLEISYDPQSWGRGLPYYHLENLCYLHHLEELDINVWKILGFKSQVQISFPLKLKKLSLTGCGLQWNDLSIVVGSLPHLEVLKLRTGACEGEEWKLNGEGFVKLRFLSIEDLKLTHWIVDGVHFGRLERLVIRNCNNLEQIPSMFGESSTLTRIVMDSSSASAVDSAEKVRETQQDFGNDYFQLVISKWGNAYFNYSPMKQKHFDFLFQD